MDFICLDIETTGLDNSQDSIIEFAAVRFNETQILDEYQSFIHFEGPIPPIVEHLTGITSDMLTDAPKLNEVKAKIIEFCGDLPIIGHNINFDLNFLDVNAVPIPGIRVDTLPIAQILIEDSPSYSLETLCRKINEKHFPSHRAMDDVLANVELFHTFLKKIKGLNPHQAYLWNQILSNSASDVASILIDHLPSEQSKPEFKELSKTHSRPENKKYTSPNITKDSDINFDEVSTKECLVVTSHEKITENKDKFTQLPRIYSLISPAYFEKQISESMLGKEQTYFLLKIATRIKEDAPLYKTDLKIFGEDHSFVGSILHETYLIPKSEKPYIVDHRTFFSLLEKDELPDLNELHFDKLPFLEEKLIRSKEKMISLLRAENGVISEEMTVLFGQLGMYLRRLFSDITNPFEPLIMDPIEVQSTNFRNFLSETSKLTTNEELKEEIELLNSSATNYLIWAQMREGYAPSIHFIEKDINYDLDLLLRESGYEDITIHTPEDNADIFYLNTKEEYPAPNTFGHSDTVSTQIKAKFADLEHEGLVLCTSKAQMTEIHQELAQYYSDKGVSMLTQGISGSKGKILDNIENRESPLILVCTFHFLLAFKPNFAKLERVILTRLPMTLPNHPYYSYLKQKVQNDFMELTIPHSAKVIYEICNTVSNYNPELNSITLMDNRIETTSWGQEIKTHLPQTIISNIE